MSNDKQERFRQHIKSCTQRHLHRLLAIRGIIRWKDQKHADDWAFNWMDSTRPIVIDWEKIESICAQKIHFRMMGSGSIETLREFTGIRPPEEVRCKCCGQKMRKAIKPT